MVFADRLPAVGERMSSARRPAAEKASTFPVQESCSLNFPVGHGITAVLLEHQSPASLEHHDSLVCCPPLLLLLAVDPDACSNDSAAHCEDRVDASVILVSGPCAV